MNADFFFVPKPSLPRRSECHPSPFFLRGRGNFFKWEGEGQQNSPKCAREKEQDVSFRSVLLAKKGAFLVRRRFFSAHFFFFLLPIFFSSLLCFFSFPAGIKPSKKGEAYGAEIRQGCKVAKQKNFTSFIYNPHTQNILL